MPDVYVKNGQEFVPRVIIVGTGLKIIQLGNGKIKLGKAT